MIIHQLNTDVQYFLEHLLIPPVKLQAALKYPNTDYPVFRYII